MRKYLTGVSALVACLVLIFALSLVPWKSIGHSQRPIRVVTSLNFYGEVAGEVAGRYGQVTSLINNAAVDPHDFQPGTDDARKMEEANVVIQNGLGYDTWLTKLANSTARRHCVHIDVGQQVAGKHDGDNEHVWYQPQLMRHLAYYLAGQYGRLDPRHAGYYHQRAQKYTRSLKKMEKEIALVKRQVGSKRDVAVSEPVFDYALHALGYRVIDAHFEKAIEDGNDPSPEDIRNLQQAISDHQIAFFVENSQTSDRVVNNLVKMAERNGVPVLRVTESKPNKMTYPEWMLKQYQELAAIQRKGE